MSHLLLAADVIVRNVYDTDGYAVGWFTLSLINAGLAQSKNRSALGWWLGSLFIGPIATLLIVVLPKLPTILRPVRETPTSNSTS
ncbi:MAG TPA: hypothetical protein VMJ32_01690 [Pirellulales bacterium]|nr:hypothetical protein [Pirellulales bacterium]